MEWSAVLRVCWWRRVRTEWSIATRIGPKPWSNDHGGRRDPYRIGGPNGFVAAGRSAFRFTIREVGIDKPSSSKTTAASQTSCNACKKKKPLLTQFAERRGLLHSFYTSPWRGAREGSCNPLIQHRIRQFNEAGAVGTKNIATCLWHQHHCHIFVAPILLP